MSQVKRITILIVEDEMIVANDLRAMLRDMGYETCGIAATSDEALSIFAEKQPDLVLMDIRIRGAVDGIATAELLKKESDTPIVYLTAHADESTLARAKGTKPHGYLVKPVSVEGLRSTVELALHRSTMERELREREKWFSTTVNSLTDGLVTVDLAGRVIFLNPAAEALTGRTSEAEQGNNIEDVLHFVDFPAEVDENEFLHPPAVTRERMLCHLQTGSCRAVLETTAPVLDGSKPLGTVVVLRDLTEYANLRTQLEKSDRLAALGTMAAGTAHEINNPLAAVLANTEALTLELDALRESGQAAQDEQWSLLQENLEDTHEALHRIARIVSDLRIYAQPGRSPSDAVDLNACVSWATRATASAFRYRAPITIDLGDVRGVQAEQTRLEQVLVNLLLNAAQAIPEGRFDGNEVRVSAREMPDGNVRIKISDTGTGIRQADLDKVFDPFFTTKDVGEGTGLGLSICRGIVASFGGTITVESQLGCGTTVTVSLPSTRGLPVPVPVPVPVPPLRNQEYQPARILLVDDDDLVPRAACRVLAPHHIDCVSSGHDALALLARDSAFDVIISDLMMPGMTGKDFYEALQDQYPSLVARVVFLTGGATSKEFEDFLQQVPNLCVEKPFVAATLKNAIASVLRRGNPANGDPGPSRHHLTHAR